MFCIRYSIYLLKSYYIVWYMTINNMRVENRALLMAISMCDFPCLPISFCRVLNFSALESSSESSRLAFSSFSATLSLLLLRLFLPFFRRGIKAPFYRGEAYLGRQSLPLALNSKYMPPIHEGGIDSAAEGGGSASKRKQKKRQLSREGRKCESAVL